MSTPLLEPPAYGDSSVSPDSSTAGPDSPHCGPRKGLGFVTAPEPSPADNTQRHVPARLNYGSGALNPDPAAAGQTGVNE